jgi:hypothetical protein
MIKNARQIAFGVFIMSRSASVSSGMAASRAGSQWRRIHTLARGHVMRIGIVVMACSATALSSIMFGVVFEYIYYMINARRSAWISKCMFAMAWRSSAFAVHG